MKIAIIADDLTGAGDTGVQFARGGMKTLVLLRSNPDRTPDADVLILDTDSRSLSAEEAYAKVRKAAEYVKICGAEVVFKKIDSTLRGNIGAELDAVYDAFQPDFVVFAPAYPQYGRVVRHGHMHVDGKPLHETEFAHDPKTPIADSSVPRLIGLQSVRKVGLVTEDDLASDDSALAAKLEQFRREGVAYLAFDSAGEDDLKRIVHLFDSLPYRVAWSGCAGLAPYLAGGVEAGKAALPKTWHPVLTIVGSVHIRTRRQMETALSLPDVRGVKLLSHLAVAGEVEWEEELERICREAGESLRSGFSVILYSSGSPEEIELAQKVGGVQGLTPVEVSNCISLALGLATARLLRDFPVNRLVLTGGDTAKQVSNCLNVHTFELIDEVETGVPVGILHGERPIYGVTKAGGFGSENVLAEAIKILQGEETTCAQS
ncbi:four-carbon acid sugar kinase family protein [Cohnella zeiphila]|uniref:Four-carbon acid sugar kinase family protein n=1 Tax=Cohnella zeiphila TaxID=2761120 RepID=A0A7X0VU59_9BACL|nr:four-carbon acid sugar kinase family protein [Cohnella zeiphila]MBB6730671.1 four-carbon acid sugar kinase family protein [Cohnella zeiphila]